MTCSRVILLAGLSLALSLQIRAEGDLQTITVDQTLKLDAIGNGTMTLKLTLTGIQFQNWQARYGQNQSLIKRDFSKFVSQYVTSDWDVQEKQIDRLVTISVKFKGAVLHKGGGVFEFRVPKQWRGGERTGTTYAFNFIEPSGSAIMQNNVKLILPESASNFAEDKSETGDRIIQYAVSVAGSGRGMLWAGLALLLAGAGASAFAFLKM